ncbi:MAG: integrase [Xanthobacteraceae bacterium]
MISEVYDAFLAAGAPEEKARKAAEAVSNYQRFDNVDRNLLMVRALQVLLKWMFGFGIALDIAILIRVFFR